MYLIGKYSCNATFTIEKSLRYQQPQLTHRIRQLLYKSPQSWEEYSTVIKFFLENIAKSLIMIFLYLDFFSTRDTDSNETYKTLKFFNSEINLQIGDLLKSKVL